MRCDDIANFFLWVVCHQRTLKSPNALVVSLPPVVVMMISPNLKIIGIQLGMAISISDFGMLIGEPIADAILNANAEWKGLQVWCGVLIFLSSVLALVARLYRTGFVFMAKA